MIYIVNARNYHEEKEWRTKLKANGFHIYDHMYPFRLATQKVTRSRDLAIRCGISLDQVAEDLASLTASKAHPNYVYEYFLDWYNQNRQPTDVAIFGFRKGYAYDYATRSLVERGAREVYDVSQLPCSDRGNDGRHTRTNGR
jgi:hypothetical protein